jgi:hypothetical protein
MLTITPGPLAGQTPNEKDDDQDSHDKGSVRTGLKRNEHQLHVNAPVRLRDSEIVSGGTARGRRHTPRVARSGARLTRPFGIKSPAMLPR